MTTLFPTFNSLWQRAKRFLATDTREIWGRIEATLEADEQRYINQSRLRAIDADLHCFGLDTFR